LHIRKILLIVNPVGGIKNGLAILDRIKPIFKAGGIELEIIETKYSGHTKDIARAMNIDRFESICLVGGDGTFHEALNGMFARSDGKRLPLGLIPAGTGNALMHDLKCIEPSNAAECIVKGYTKMIDLAEVSMDHKKVYVAVVIGWGMITDIGLRAEGVRWMGENRYTYAALMEIMNHRTRHAKLIIEGKEYDEKFVFLMACLSKYQGTNMLMAPKAKLDDGLIDLLIVRSTTRKKMLNLFPKIFTGEHIHSDILEYKQIKEYSLIPDNDDSVNLDGETIGSTPIHVKVLKQSLEIYTSKEIAEM
jgi:YegS/Rv2252/BmrU family lipid kinase